MEIDGEAYWDGGYLGNPALWPLYHERMAADIVLVQLNPLLRPELPTSTSDIMNRLNEISFNASLMSEMRAIDFVQRMLDSGRLEQPRYRRIFLHAIEDGERMRAFKLSTKFNGDWDFLQTLRDYGRDAAGAFHPRASGQGGPRKHARHSALPVDETRRRGGRVAPPRWLPAGSGGRGASVDGTGDHEQRSLRQRPREPSPSRMTSPRRSRRRAEPRH